MKKIVRDDPVTLRPKTDTIIAVNSDDEFEIGRRRRNRKEEFYEALLKLWMEKLKRRKDECYLNLAKEDDYVEEVESDSEENSL